MIKAEELEKLKAMMGTEYKLKVEIERGVIWRLAEAVDDPNPLWKNENEAKKTKYGGVIAPPALNMSQMLVAFLQEEPLLPVIGTGGFEAEHESEFYAPIHAGDVITATSKLVDIYEKQGKKSGRMVFYVYDTILINQRGEVVGKERGSQVRF